MRKRECKSILGALRASNWLFMVVGVLMAMTILWILEEDEDNRVKYVFSKKQEKKVMAFS